MATPTPLRPVQRFRLFLLSVSWTLFFVPIATARSEGAGDYLYADSRELVRLVEQAASLIERQGAEAFSAFAVKGSKWLHDERYLFVYDETGTAVFHPVEPELQGQDLSHFTDIQGRSVIAGIMEIGRMPQPNASGWVFYLWEGPWHARPQWKGSFVRKAISPDGTVFLVGSGLYNVKIEKTFVLHAVDRAAELLGTQGKEAAFAEFRRVASPLHFLDAYIQVTDDEGNVLVDPLFPTLGRKRNISQGVDFAGNKPFQKIKAALQQREAAWTSVTVPKPASGVPEKRLIYTRKVTLGAETFYVSMSYVPAPPIWLK